MPQDQDPADTAGVGWGICSFKPRSLGLRDELLLVELGGVVNRGGNNGLSGAGLGNL